ncbi:YwqG family protein [Actinoplanes sp. L3-i22]|uniref:YwqG family protein n=1 Tax=Actinoplanes sp. L3-i22 TaxID=2836373 RepID=UPI001C792B0B|nr:YwqG family protein [Actinoplanes sp. L3-i22]BCY12035.1 hypothetical protein L3i22_071230 [Actinoplanes sp. L3-i22]
MEIDATALERFCDTLPEKDASHVRGLALPSVELRPGPAGSATRFGGVPLAGPGFAWPRADDGRPLALLGELDTDQVNQWLGATALPAGTLLSFFFADDEDQGFWGMRPDSAQYWRVIATRKTDAAPATPPDRTTIFPAHPLTGRSTLTVPDSWDPAIAEFAGSNSGYVQLWLDWDGPLHRVFGWPEVAQNPMPEDLQLVSNGVDLFGPLDRREPRIRELIAGGDDWLLLWQIDSDERNLGWMWGDMGRLYYWIHRADLAAGRFDRVWVLVQG